MCVLDKYIDGDFESPNYFPEEDLANNSYEGALKRVLVNKYERSSVARQKCIEYHGCVCSICGFDFEKVYGDLGKGFIHIHHIVPLNKINKEYKVNYKTDLIPVSQIAMQCSTEKSTIKKLVLIIFTNFISDF